MNAAEVIAPIIAAIFAGGGVSAILMAMVARSKAKSEIKVIEADADKKAAETTDIIVQAAGKAAEILGRQLCVLSDQNAAMKLQIDTLLRENADLREGQQRHEKEILGLQAIAEHFDELLTGAQMLYEQVVELKVEPKYKPPERKARKGGP